jgi:lactoylglutathione lyase
MASPTRSSLGATGIGVSDLQRSVDFYTRVIGMKTIMKLKLPYMDEVLVSFGGRSTAVALMHWTDGTVSSYENLPVKVVFYVPDPAALAEAIEAEGLEIIRKPTPVPELGDAVVGLARDPDGYIVEILQAPDRD